MTTRIDQPPAGQAVTACPYLGLRDDRATMATFVTPGHRCYRHGSAAPVAIEHQARFCLSDAHRACPVFAGAATAPPSVRMTHRPMTRFGAAAAGIALLVAGAGIVRMLRGDARTVVPPAAFTTPAIAPSPAAAPSLTPASTSPASPTAAPSPAPPPLRYIVREGDNLTEIALFFGVRPEDLIEANGLPRNGRLVTGQELIIPRAP